MIFNKVKASVITLSLIGALVVIPMGTAQARSDIDRRGMNAVNMDKGQHSQWKEKFETMSEEERAAKKEEWKKKKRERWESMSDEEKAAWKAKKEERFNKMLDEHFKDLSPEEKAAKLQEIKTHREKIRAELKDLPKEERRARMKEIRKEMQEKYGLPDFRRGGHHKNSGKNGIRNKDGKPFVKKGEGPFDKPLSDDAAINPGVAE